MKLSRIGWQLTVDNRGQRVKFDQDRSPECTFLASHVVCGSAPTTSCYLMGFDERSSKNCDHRKRWLEEKLKNLQRDEEAGCYNCRCRNMKNPTRESIDASHD